MTHRSLVAILIFALAGCADPAASVSVKAATTSKASAAPAVAKPSTEAPPAPVAGGTAGLISPGGATVVAPKTGTDVPAGIKTDPTSTLISNDGGGIKGSASDGNNDPGGWTVAPSPTPTPAR